MELNLFTSWWIFTVTTCSVSHVAICWVFLSSDSWERRFTAELRSSCCSTGNTATAHQVDEKGNSISWIATYSQKRLAASYKSGSHHIIYDPFGRGWGNAVWRWETTAACQPVPEHEPPRITNATQTFVIVSFSPVNMFIRSLPEMLWHARELCWKPIEPESNSGILISTTVHAKEARGFGARRKTDSTFPACRPGCWSGQTPFWWCWFQKAQSLQWGKNKERY